MQSILSKIPDFVRWIILLPVSFLGAVIINVFILYILHLGLTTSFGENVATNITQRLSFYVIGYSFVHLLGSIAPTHKLIAAKIASIMYVILCIALYSFIFVKLHLRLFALLDISLVCILGGVGTYQAYVDLRKNTQ